MLFDHLFNLFQSRLCNSAAIEGEGFELIGVSISLLANGPAVGSESIPAEHAIKARWERKHTFWSMEDVLLLHLADQPSSRVEVVEDVQQHQAAHNTIVTEAAASIAEGARDDILAHVELLHSLRSVTFLEQVRFKLQETRRELAKDAVVDIIQVADY